MPTAGHERLGASKPTAVRAIQALESAGILEELTGKEGGTGSGRIADTSSDFGSAPRSEPHANLPTGSKPPKPTPSQREADEDGATPAARNLALAHHLERLIEHGVIADYTQAARVLEVSQPRVTHLMSLLLLSPQIQADILAGRIEPTDKELRGLARVAEWTEQADALTS